MLAQGKIAPFLKKLRKRLALTQEKFAARLGVTLPTVCRWENNKTKPSPLAWKRIKDLLHALGDEGTDLLNKYFVGQKNDHKS